MDAVKFLKERERMCGSFGELGCGGCEIYGLRNAVACIFTPSCETYCNEHPEKVVPIVEKWSAEHPVKTRLQDFLEKHPNARLHPEDGTPLTTPAVLGYCKTKYCDECEQIHYTMAHCWNLPLEE